MSVNLREYAESGEPLPINHDFGTSGQLESEKDLYLYVMNGLTYVGFKSPLLEVKK